ncbi:MAG: hypothetical protein EA392_10445 [Cryomorphaceae bacterium]|nr:MAG: hypothetical protein EA392_10445 [Cryomorphaceae bacterium]
MQDLEPYYDWRNLYAAEADERSPFFAREYSEFTYTDHIYDHYIHPQWDNMGSPSLFIKLLFADYDEGFCIIEMIGEWNDCLHNDIMTLKRDIIEHLQYEGIHKFILIGENVLNFHASDDCYYEEWFEEVSEEDGWICLLNFRDFVLAEMSSAGIDQYMAMGGSFNTFNNWRTFRPLPLYQKIEQLFNRRMLPA